MILTKKISQNISIYNSTNYTSRIGANGIIDAEAKIEGDLCTPTGDHTVTHGYYRADRIAKPETLIPMSPITPEMGWCDEPTHPAYNQLIQKPFEASHEDLWREDHLYDIVLVTNHNTNPTIPGRGSAIFIHLAESDPESLRPSAGCLKLQYADLLHILKTCGDTLIWRVS
jgi:L,D-peptidoglycan transpeptidase YkuD (ErfK/YbiS/YcfS/YnhG family)